MDVMLTYDREAMDGLGSSDVLQLIQSHMENQVPGFQKNLDYYLGQHAILEKERTDGNGNEGPNAQPVCNHAKDIADTAAGYFLGNPITYRLVGQEPILDTGPEPLTSDGPVLAFIYLDLVHSEQSVGPPRTRVSSSRLSSGLQNAVHKQPSLGCQACVSLRGWTLLPA